MNLTIDIGNTRIKAGVFKDTKLIANCVIESHSVKALQDFIKKYPAIDNAILSTTVDYPASLKSYLSKKFKLVELSEKTALPFKNGYKTPQTLGKDRLASVAGAQHIAPKKNALVINAGTCITYDYIDKNEVYHGGSISPGLEMRFKALHTFTGRLPLIEPQPTNKELLGKTTKESIVTGVQQGMAEEVQGFIHMYKKRYSNVQIILTGGSMAWLKTMLKDKIIYDPFVTLKGLNVILALHLKRENPKY